MKTWFSAYWAVFSPYKKRIKANFKAPYLYSRSNAGFFVLKMVAFVGLLTNNFKP